MKSEHIIVVGSSRGIGASIAKSIYDFTNYKLLLCSRKTYEFKNNYSSNFLKSKRILVKTLDISCEEKVSNLLKFIIKKKIRIKGLINCAGDVGIGGKITKIRTKDWDKTIKINLYGTFFLYKYFTEYLVKRNTKTFLLNFSGGGGTGPFAYLDSYAVSKVAINRLCENISEEYINSDFITFSISPGSINTDMFYDFAKQYKNLGPKLNLEINDRLNKGGADIEKPSRLILFFIKNINKLDHLSGRIISAQFDNYNKLLKNKKKIINTDLLKLRRVDKKIIKTKIL